eukprot:scaffold7673_cov258-Pinguiococcus_pyrenoidosus.AAC.16
MSGHVHRRAECVPLLVVPVLSGHGAVGREWDGLRGLHAAADLPLRGRVVGHQQQPDRPLPGVLHPGLLRLRPARVPVLARRDEHDGLRDPPAGEIALLEGLPRLRPPFLSRPESEPRGLLLPAGWLLRGRLLDLVEPAPLQAAGADRSVRAKHLPGAWGERRQRHREDA